MTSPSQLEQQQPARERWVSINVEACQSQLHNIVALRACCEVALCSEVKLTASGQKAIETDLLKVGWKAIWGELCPLNQRRGKGASIWGARKGGVACLVDRNRPARRLPLQGRAAQFEKAGRLLLTAIPYGNCRGVIYAVDHLWLHW